MSFGPMNMFPDELAKNEKLILLNCIALRAHCRRDEEEFY